MRVRTVALATLAGTRSPPAASSPALASRQGAYATGGSGLADVHQGGTADETPVPVGTLDRHPRIGLLPVAELAMVADDLDLGEHRNAIAVGSTSTEPAIAQGVDPADLVAALVGVAEASNARAEERGRLDAGRAAELRERLEARVTETVEGLREGKSRGAGRQVTWRGTRSSTLTASYNHPMFGPLNGVRTALVLMAAVAAVIAAALGWWWAAVILLAGVAVHGLGWFYLWRKANPD
jgi:hypothetical protein